MTLLAGIDIGGSKVLAVALDEAGTVVAQTRLASSGGPAGVVATAIEAVRALGARPGVELSEFRAVGVGVPGLVEPRSGAVSHAVNLGLVGTVDLGAMLGRHLGLPVVVENDVNAAALGAARVLDLDGRDLAYLSIGTGLAAGLVIGGRLRRGARGAAGEIGHIPVDPDGPVCACGQRGCLETLASGSALSSAWAARDGLSPAESLFAAATAGDPAAVAARDRFTDSLAAAVRLLVLTCDVETVVLGGGVTDVGSALLESVRDALARQSADSPFLASLELPQRVAMVAPGSAVAAVGAALAGREVLTAPGPRSPIGEPVVP
ncbi:putative NBD/HSP70 family sugar kinase [Motilibacter peucedani]|uniref:Putative NBD/HSP70 family sugar kinase n=1 Tax=Motilibacter peucedani TaxID=598650 RepID=A0A420XLQ5_9ACTN|nr:ROK family protein [Motilibacter peucedani]RKS69368.1 putative NBD/HSP70 family sugar kinase [Motilibacter peucedani]